MSTTELNTSDLNARIADAEARNGIRTPAERLLAASLLIEPTFLYPGIIAGQTEGIELAFGKEEWVRHLTAQGFAAQYKGALTPDFITELYRIYLGRSDSDTIIEDTRFEKGWLGTGTNKAFVPMTCTQEPIDVLNRNPYTEWLNLTMPNDIDDVRRLDTSSFAYQLFHNRGWLVTSKPSMEGCINYIHKTRDEKMQELTTICSQYEYRRKRTHDPDELSASVQRALTSLHAGPDCNGRVGRMVGNWSLKREGLAPSIPNPNDLLMPLERHIRYIRGGRMQQTESREKIASGITDESDIFGLAAERSRFIEAGFPSPPPLEPGKIHNSALFELFLRAIRSAGSMAIHSY